MNKFGSAKMQALIDELREAAAADTAPHLSELLTDAADTLKAADGYFVSVESALV